MTMFGSLAIARRLTDAGIERAHADAIADGISRAAEHGDHVTPDAFAADFTALRTEIAATELRLIRWIIATGAAGIVIAAIEAARLTILPEPGPSRRCTGSPVGSAEFQGRPVLDRSTPPNAPRGPRARFTELASAPAESTS